MTELALKGFSEIRRGAGKLTSVWVLIALIPLAVGVLDPARTSQIIEIAIRALLGTLPYIAVAVLMIAYLKASGAEAMVARAFEGREHRMIVFAALFGGLAPFCSCEVIPFIAGLLALGAPLSAVMAFWLSSPLIDPPTLFITAASLGWPFAIVKAAAAILIGLFGGFAVAFLLKQGAFTNALKPQSSGGCCGCGPSPFEGKPVWQFWSEGSRRETFRREGANNAVFLLKWLSLAYLLEGLLITYVPAEAVATVVGGEGVLPIVIGALVGAPAYLNSYAAPPLVAGLVTQGMTMGAAMAFMVAGSVSSIPAMAAVWSLVRPQVFAAYLSLGIGGAILIGIGYGALAPHL